MALSDLLDDKAPAAEEGPDTGEIHARALLRALKANDAKGLLAAFENLYSHCADKGPAEADLDEPVDAVAVLGPPK